MSTTSPECALSCSPGELYTLASLLGGEMLIGVPDPFPGWLTEEIQEAMEKAMRSLTARGILSSRGEGTVVMDVVAAALVGSLVAPQAAFIVTLTLPDHTFRQLNIYHRAPLTAVLEPREDEWTLWFLPDTESIARQVQELWHLGHQTGVPSPSLSLPENVLEEARQARSGGAAEILSRLATAGVSGEGAQALAHTLATACQNGALVALSARQGVWNTGGLGMLEGENGLWLLRPFSRQQVLWTECIPCSGEQLAAKVALLIGQFMPFQEG